MRLIIPEILALVEKAETKDEKIAVLRKNNSPVLQKLLQLTYHPEAKTRLPEGEPPFRQEKDLPVGYADSNLYQEARRLYIFYQASNLPKIKLESLFIGILEGVHPTEAKLLCAVKDKDLTRLYPSVTYQLVEASFPNLLPPYAPPVEEVGNEAPKEDSTASGSGAEEKPKKRGGRPKGSKNKPKDGLTSTTPEATE